MTDLSINQVSFKHFDNEDKSTVNYYQKALNYFANILTYVLMGSILVVNLWFVFDGNPFDLYRQHIFFCVLGYQLLMAVSIQSLCSGNSWSAYLTLRHRLRVHWILQVFGSVFAIAGSIIEIKNQYVHFYSWHGTLGIIAMGFTVISFINGVTSLYATELSPYITPNISKISHIVFGTATYVCAGASLYFGYDHWTFVEFSSIDIVYLMMTLTAIHTVFVVWPPFLTFYRKLKK